jgi:hypothetical protein
LNVLTSIPKQDISTNKILLVFSGICGALSICSTLIQKYFNFNPVWNNNPPMSNSEAPILILRALIEALNIIVQKKEKERRKKFS